jgi:RNA polymerase sigma factor (sigma-70 family)
MGTRSKQDRCQHLAAFEAAVQEYQAALLRYAARIVYDPDAAQDVVQNAFIRLFNKWKDPLDPSPQLSSWLYRVTHNCAVDYLRRETRRRELHRKQADEKPGFAAPDRGLGLKISERAEDAARALHTLSLREQQLVVLKVYEEKTYKEISEITGLSVGNVGYILHHAMKNMAAELQRISTS